MKGIRKSNEDLDDLDRVILGLEKMNSYLGQIKVLRENLDTTRDTKGSMIELITVHEKIHSLMVQDSIKASNFVLSFYDFRTFPISDIGPS